MSSPFPLIVVVGPTGSGKTQLSLDLSTVFPIEVVSADSRQVFRSLSVASAKVSLDQQTRVSHHLVSVLSDQGMYSATRFQKEARDIVEEVTKRSRLPLVVGGTCYYIEALLFDMMEWKEMEEQEDRNEILGMENMSLHAYLEKIDPSTAKRLHPNNTRKIMRAIEIFEKTGKSWVKQLMETPRISHFPALFLYLDCDLGVLDSRLDTRVDEMIEKGLLKEVIELHLNIRHLSTYALRLSDPTSEEVPFEQKDCCIFESIGFQEFIRLFSALSPNLVIDSEILIQLEGKRADQKINAYASFFESLGVSNALQLLLQALDDIKSNTKHYARKQIRWIRARFSYFKYFITLNASDVSKWNENVVNPAVEHIKGMSLDMLIIH